MTTDAISTTSSSSDALWFKVVNEGVEDRVEVNQRMLIDKMLARYSSDFVVYRELIQNSDDAQATSFHLEITCDSSSKVHHFESMNKDEIEYNQRQSATLLEGTGKLFCNHLTTNKARPTLENTDRLLINTFIDPLLTPEIDFHNCIITEVRTVNNGTPFTEADWKRVATIAEGNTNVDAIGQFGVGFFSVFSYSERPMIQSGKHCLAFVWQNGRSLTTFRKELSLNEQSPLTSIILKMRNKYILQTKSTSTMNVETKNDTRNSMRRATNEIIPTMDLIELKAYFTKVLSFTKYINELVIKINGFIVFQVKKSIKSISSSKIQLAFKKLSSVNEHNLLHFNSFIQTEQTFTIVHGPSITLNHIDVQASLVIDEEFHDQIRRVLKKSLPSIVHIQFLFQSNNVS
jgi:hypothetical protein